MENIGNFNPEPVRKPFWSKYGRVVLTVVASLVIVVAILFVTGGVDRLGRMFGVGAATTKTLDFFGTSTLSNGATLENARVVSELEPIPVYEPAGQIVPEPKGELGIPEETSPSLSIYTSSAIDLGEDIVGNSVTLDTVRIAAFISETSTAEMKFSYRSADSPANLELAAFMALEADFNEAESPVGTSLSETAVGVAVSRYLQVRVEFEGVSISSTDAPVVNPAVYGWSFDYTPIEETVDDVNTGDQSGDDSAGDADTGETSDEEGSGEIDATTVNLVVHVTPTARPAIATSVELVSAATGSVRALATNLDMTAADSFTFDDLDIVSGAYAIVVRSDTHTTGVAATLINTSAVNVDIPAMNPVQTTCPEPEVRPAGSADLNGDGVVNASDYAMFIDQWQG
jgi:hypothetical protein